MKIIERLSIASNLMLCWIFFFQGKRFVSSGKTNKKKKKKNRWSLFGMDVSHEMGGNESFRS